MLMKSHSLSSSSSPQCVRPHQTTALVLLCLLATVVSPAASFSPQPTPAGAVILDCSTPPPFLIDDIPVPHHVLNNGSGTQGIVCGYILRCPVSAPYFKVEFGPDNTATASWFGLPGTITPAPAVYKNQQRLGLVVNTASNMPTDIIASCVTTVCDLVAPDILTAPALLIPPRIVGEFCSWRIQCPVGQFAIANLNYLDPLRSFSTVVPLEIRRGGDALNGELLYPIPTEGYAAATGKNTINIVTETNDVSIIFLGEHLDFVMMLGASCAPAKCPAVDPVRRFDLTTTKTVPYLPNNTLLAGDCPVSFQCDAARGQQAVVDVASGSCRSLTSDCAVAVKSNNIPLQGYTSPPCPVATIRVPRDITQPDCLTTIHAECKVMCSSPNDTVIEHNIGFGGIMWFANDPDGRDGGSKCAPFSECEWLLRCTAPNDRLMVNFTGQLNSRDRVSVYAETSYLVGFGTGRGFTNTPVTLDATYGKVTYRSSVKLDSDKAHERVPGRGLSFSAECKPMPSITCQPLSRVIKWAEEGVFVHDYALDRPLLDRCTWAFQCPAHMYPGITFNINGVFTEATIRMTVFNSDGTTRIIRNGDALVFADTPDVTVEVYMTGMTFRTTGSYRVHMDCYIARCSLNSTQPWVRNETTNSASYSSRHQYQDNVLQTTDSIPGMHVNEIDCVWQFRCPAELPFVGIEISGLTDGRLRFEAEADDALNTYSYYYNVPGGSRHSGFGYFMPGAGVRVTRPLGTNYFGGDQFTMTFGCYIQRCSNNRTHADETITVHDGRGTALPFGNFGYFINEECRFTLICPNPMHFVGVAGAVWLRRYDKFEAYDNQMQRFRFPTQPYYGDKVYEDGGPYSTNIGWISRRWIATFDINTTAGGRPRNLGRGRVWWFNAYCFQSYCPSNVTFERQANNTEPREERTFFNSGTWAEPEFVNAECNYTVTCPVGMYAIARFDLRMAGAMARAIVGDEFDQTSFTLLYNYAVRSQNRFLDAHFGSPVSHTSYTSGSFMGAIGIYRNRRHGVSILLQCSLHCAQHNVTPVITLPSRSPTEADSPWMSLLPPRVGRYAPRVFMGELCLWHFQCPNPTDHILIAQSLGGMSGGTGGDEVNLTAVKRLAPNETVEADGFERRLTVASGAGLRRVLTSVFLDQGDGVLLTINPRRSQHVYLRIAVRCYVDNCCNNVSQPHHIDATTPAHMRRPWGNLIEPPPLNGSFCDGRTERQHCEWLGETCAGDGFNRLLTYPITAFKYAEFPVPSDTGVFAGGTDVSRLSFTNASYEYLTNRSFNPDWTLYFTNTTEVEARCVSCNATAVGRPFVLEQFNGMIIASPHMCQHRFECPANKSIRFEVMDSTFTTPDRHVVYGLDHTHQNSSLPFGTRVTYPAVTPISSTADRRAIEFSYHAVPNPAGTQYGPPLMVRFECRDSACDLSEAQRQTRVDSRVEVLTQAQASVGNQYCEWSFNVACESRCQTHFDIWMNRNWRRNDFEEPLDEPDFDPMILHPNVTLYPTFSPEAPWTPPLRLRRDRQRSPDYYDPTRIRAVVTTTRAGIVSRQGRRLPRVYIETVRQSETPSLTVSDHVSESTSESVSTTLTLVPTESVSISVSDSITLSQSVSRSESGDTPSMPLTVSESLSFTESVSLSDSDSPSVSESLSTTTSVSLSSSLSFSESESQSETFTLSSSDSPSLSTSDSMSVSETVSVSESLSVSGTSSSSVSMTQSFSFSDTIFTTPWLHIEPAEIDQNVIARAHRFPDSARILIFRPMGEKFDFRWTLGREFDVFDPIFDRIRLSENSVSRTGFMANSREAWTRYSILSYNETMLVARLHPTPRYFSLRDDTVSFSFEQELFGLRFYNTSMPARLRLKKPYRGWLNEDAKNATRVLSYLAAAGGVAGLQASRAMAMMKLDGCENPIDAPPPRNENPVGVPITNAYTRYYVGQALMNLVIIVGALIVHASIAGFVAGVLRRPFRAGASLVMFPNLLLLPMMFLYGPTTAAGGVIIGHEAVLELRMIGAAVLIVALAVPAAIGALTLSRANFKAQQTIDLVELYKRDSLRVFFLGRYTWVDDADRVVGDPKLPGGGGGSFCRRFGLFFDAFKVKRQWFLIIEVLTSFALAGIEAIKPDDGDCTGIAIGSFVVMLVYLAALVVLAPYSAPVEMVIVFTIALLQSAGYLFAILAHYRPASFDYLIPATVLFALFIVILALLLAIVDIGARVYEMIERLLHERREKKAAEAAALGLGGASAAVPPTSSSGPPGGGASMPVDDHHHLPADSGGEAPNAAATRSSGGANPLNSLGDGTSTAAERRAMMITGFDTADPLGLSGVDPFFPPPASSSPHDDGRVAGSGGGGASGVATVAAGEAIEPWGHDHAGGAAPVLPMQAGGGGPDKPGAPSAGQQQQQRQTAASSTSRINPLMQLLDSSSEEIDNGDDPDAAPSRSRSRSSSVGGSAATRDVVEMSASERMGL